MQYFGISGGNAVKKCLIAISLLLFSLKGLFAAAVIDNNFNSETISSHLEYLEDPSGSLQFEEARRSSAWNQIHTESVTFGFTSKTYWFKFSLENQSALKNFLFEITYPLLDSVIFYKPDGKGGYARYETGDKLPFSHRPFTHVSFIFPLEQDEGTQDYYFRIQTTSSFTFAAKLYTVTSFFQKLNEEMPAIWIFYGLLIIMIVYNFIIFVSSRDVSYFYYSLFIACWVVLQMCLNGYSFQYLWPNSLWWQDKANSFFMAITYFSVGLFFIYFMELPEKYPKTNIVCWASSIVPGFILAMISLVIPYAISIKITSAFSGVSAAILYTIGLILWLKYKSRQAFFVQLAFLGFVIGIVLYVFKTFGILPANFVTHYSIQIGATLMIILLSLGLADKINTMRRDLQVLLTRQKESERIAVEKAEFLRGIVETVNHISGDFTKVSRELRDISQTFSQLSMEQASTSEEMSATFDELVSSIERIHQSTLYQQAEGEKSKKYTDDLSGAQRNMVKESIQVARSVEAISEAAKTTEESLKSMTERMQIINDGGKEIDQFVAIIDDISDRINLLSLNAAIEAARAGEYGRGFAVVADEIGKLAQATSDNSKSIANRIKTIISDIEEGTRLVMNTKESTDVIFSMVDTIQKGIEEVKNSMAVQNKTLETVVKQASLIETLSKEVATSTQEQKDSMVQTLHTIERLSEMAMEISSANQRIIGFIQEISLNSEKLAKAVEGTV